MNQENQPGEKTIEPAQESPANRKTWQKPEAKAADVAEVTQLGHSVQSLDLGTCAS